MRINEKIIRNKVGLLNLAEELGNVSKAHRSLSDSFQILPTFGLRPHFAKISPIQQS